MTTTTETLTLDTARLVDLSADPLRVCVYEGRGGALSFTQLPGFDEGWVLEFAPYRDASKYDAGWRYVGSVPYGDSARVLADFYLNLD